MSSRFGVLAAILIAGVTSSCSHSDGPPDHTKPDTLRDTLHIVPDSGRVQTGTWTVFRIVPKNFQLPLHYSVSWQFDTTHQTVQDKDTLPYSFATAGTHTIAATLLDSVNHTLATARTIQVDTDRVIRPNDTTSQNFEWTEYTGVNGENNMTGCWVFGPQDIWAINGDLHHFDGSSWSRIVVHDQHGQSYEYGLSGASIFGISDDDMWFVLAGSVFHYVGSGLVYRYDTWNMMKVWTHSAWGTSSNDLSVVGDSGAVFHFDGTNWTKMSTPTKKALGSIWGTSDNDIWVAGYDPQTGQAEALHYDGSAWSIDALASSGLAQQWGINNIFAYDSSGHHGVAALGWTVFRRTDQGVWRSDSGKVPNDVSGRIFMSCISGNGANDLLCAGDNGLILHWSGGSWKRYEQFLEPSNPSYFPRQISLKGNAACVVGYKSGSSWVLIGQRQ